MERKKKKIDSIIEEIYFESNILNSNFLLVLMNTIFLYGLFLFFIIHGIWVIPCLIVIPFTFYVLKRYSKVKFYSSNILIIKLFSKNELVDYRNIEKAYIGRATTEASPYLVLIINKKRVPVEITKKSTLNSILDFLEEKGVKVIRGGGTLR